MYSDISVNFQNLNHFMKSAHCPGVPPEAKRFTHATSMGLILLDAEAGDPAECFNASSFSGIEQHDAGQCLGYCKVGVFRRGAIGPQVNDLSKIGVGCDKVSRKNPGDTKATVDRHADVWGVSAQDGCHHLIQWPTRPQDWPRKNNVNIIHKELCV